MPLLFQLICATVGNNIFCSSQYHSSKDHPLLHYVHSFVRKLRRKINLDCIVVNLSWLYVFKSNIMNKMILTYYRTFMSIVGPGGSGKTELMFQMLAGEQFIFTF